MYSNEPNEQAWPAGLHHGGVINRLYSKVSQLQGVGV